MIKKIIFMHALIFFTLLCAESRESSQSKVDVVVFAYNRALQLNVFLKSLYSYCTNVGKVFVIYRAVDDFFEKGFELLKARYPHIEFIRQGENPEQDFKQYVLDVLYEREGSQYVLFAVDDALFKDFTDFSLVASLMEKYKAYGFYLRLGMHINWCYSAQVKQVLPPYKEVEDSVCLWNLSEGVVEFGYPHDLTGAVYRKKDIEEAFRAIEYIHPNEFEGRWSSWHPKNTNALCFKRSKVIVLPLNKVQQYNNNVTMDIISVDTLNQAYLNGYIFDTTFLHQIANNACCYEYLPQFIKNS